MCRGGQRLSCTRSRSSPPLTRHAARLGHGALTKVPVTGPPATSVSTEEPIIAVIRQLQQEEAALLIDGEGDMPQPSGRDMTTIITALSKRVERLQV